MFTDGRIAEIFQADRTTVIHGYQKIGDNIHSSKELKAKYIMLLVRMEAIAFGLVETEEELQRII